LGHSSPDFLDRKLGKSLVLYSDEYIKLHAFCFNVFSPSYAIPKVLEKAGLQLSDIDVWEVHEAFAVS
jgi:hypothetical protein